jgi:hypothetical protein
MKILQNFANVIGLFLWWMILSVAWYSWFFISFWVFILWFLIWSLIQKKNIIS